MKLPGIKTTIEWACNTCGVLELADDITFSINPALTSTGGLARLKKLHIELSLVFIQNCTPEEFKELIIHEACHLIDFAYWTMDRKGRPKAHGETWRLLMKMCGYTKPARCHSVRMVKPGE